MINKQKGFIKWIIIIVIALIILGYYGFDVRKAIDAPTTQHNLTYAQQIISNVWHNYLKAPTMYVWGKIYEFLRNHCYPQLVCYILNVK